MKTVIFDWGGIIENHVDPEYGWDAITEKLVKRLSNNESTVLKAWGSFPLDGNKVSVSTINDWNTFDKWINYVMNEYKINCSKEVFLKIYEEEYRKIYYYKELVDYIHSLKGKCQLCILSNLLMIDKERLNSQVDFTYFDRVFLSFELGYVKPDSKIYEEVEKELNVPVKDILFIDDVLENVEAARVRGWNTFQGTGEDITAMKKRIEEFLKEK